MCLYSSKLLRINIFPKTVYKVVVFRDSNYFEALYFDFVYKRNKIYKTSLTDIFKNRRKSFKGFDYYEGFHSYTSKEICLKMYKRILYSVAVECKIPAFSLVIPGEDESNGEILSNRIKIVKILKDE